MHGKTAKAFIYLALLDVKLILCVPFYNFEQKDDLSSRATALNLIRACQATAWPAKPKA